MPPQIASARPSTGARGMPSFKTAGSGGRVGGQAAFKPPRPQTKTGSRKAAPADKMEVDGDEDGDEEAGEEAGAKRVTAESSTRGGQKRKTGTDSRAPVILDDDDDENNDNNNLNDDDEDDDDSDNSDNDDTLPPIPPELLTRLLHHFFSKSNTRVTQDANASVCKYMEIFIREAIARSVAEKRDGGFLDVDILQKVATQLILDM